MVIIFEWATASASTQKPKSVLAAIPKNALTLEEIERSQLASSSVRQPPSTEHKPPQPMPIPSGVWGIFFSLIFDCNFNRI
ncbi:unnamed protein product [Anisakis simplex]|uniref:Uncharacterized protein n=1 Tax=Anisakis simplex TaxID=6269 RepID=A0A0M3JLY8_ANISI|nr:unnamed protein product [Anisakis simplex]